MADESDDAHTDRPVMVIPDERLPPGFVDRITQPPGEPAPLRPAATAVPLRDEGGALEVLLVKRSRSAGFVPGAYVFPGGVVDAADAHSDIQRLLQAPLQSGAPATTEGSRSGRQPTASAPTESLGSGAPPSLGFWVAAARELFEETGVLLTSPPLAEPVASRWRSELLEDRVTIADLLGSESLMLALDKLTHIAHWITPIAERRRYDTHFFLARMPEGADVRIDAREMVDAQWLTPKRAMERFAAGALPMVFPTVRTIQSLLPFDSVAGAVEGLGHRHVRPILPRLVRRGGGVGIVIDEEED